MTTTGEWRDVPFEQAFRDVTAGNHRVDQGDYLDSGILPVIDQGQAQIAGYVNDIGLACNALLPCLVFGDHTKIVKYVDHPFAIGAQGVRVLLPAPELDIRFAFYALQRVRFPADTGYSRHSRFLKRSRIAFPPLAEQRRIAAVLDKADEVSRKQHESLRLVDKFLHSAFLEMFGDPVGNERGWELRAIAEVAKVTTGNTPPRSHPEYYGASIEWIKSDNINTAEPYLTRAIEGLSPLGRRVARTAAPGAVLMTCIAGSRRCIGNVALTDREVAFNQQVNAVEPSLGVDSRFLYVLFRVGKRLVQQASTDSMKGMVTKGRLERVKIIHPPAQLQNTFGEWFNHWHAARSRHRQALEASEMLFHSLEHGAFEDAQ